MASPLRRSGVAKNRTEVHLHGEPLAIRELVRRKSQIVDVNGGAVDHRAARDVAAREGEVIEVQGDRAVVRANRQRVAV